MSRTSRLFDLIETLRRHRTPVTAAHLAQEMGVSQRTIYRDIQTLIGMGAAIDGEAGIGYLLRPGFFMPPLMFTPEELEALVLGVRWVCKQGDATLADAAENLLAKIATAAPTDLRDQMADTGLWAPMAAGEAAQSPLLKDLREAIRHETRLSIRYNDLQGSASERIIWPFALAYFQRTRILAAWCELRQGFRHFRTERIESLEPVAGRYPRRRAALVQAWRKEMGFDAHLLT
ncbi:helix-turn-helix transcriptional regulator [Lacibacterium aquatile]|uniref:Helix-turn-helix transcriptional regulator n=1 Tax=Lacibacterium aquatile TaxID=1168082 RepID=A0ABW5DNY9_9PROT